MKLGTVVPKPERLSKLQFIHSGNHGPKFVSINICCQKLDIEIFENSPVIWSPGKIKMRMPI